MRRAAILAAACTCLWLVACAGPPAPADRYLRLLPEAPAALATPVLDGTVLVKRFAAEGVLGQRPVLHARAGAPESLQQYNYHFWAEAPPVMLQELAVDALRASGVARQVVTPQHGVDAAFVLVGRLRRLEHLTGDAPSVAVALELGVQESATRSLLLLKTYEDSAAVEEVGIEAAAGAMSGALARIFGRFVSDLAGR